MTPVPADLLMPDGRSWDPSWEPRTVLNGGVAPPSGWSAMRGQPAQASDPALAALVERFGLLSVYVPGPEATTLDQDPERALIEARRTVDRLAHLLEQACAQMGIEPAIWGKVAPVLHAVEQLERPARSASDRPTLSYGVYSRVHRRITVAIGGPNDYTRRREARLETTLVHEWVHALDHRAVHRHHAGLPHDVALSDYAQQPLGPLATVAPDALLRSATLMVRILDELNGRAPPALDPQPWSRFRAWHHARQWARATQRHDAQAGRPYYARGSEMLARVVQFHQRDTLDDLMNLPGTVAMGLTALPQMPSRPLHGSVALIRTWMAYEGVGTMDRLLPAVRVGRTPDHVASSRAENPPSKRRPGF